jgi:hypothetical protein
VTPVITAFVGAVVVLAGALVARNATRYAAELDAAQRRRDAELAHLREFRDVLIDALTHASVYRFALNRIAPDTAEQDRFDEAVRVLERTGGREAFRIETAEILERLRILADGLLWPELREAFRPIGDVLADVDTPHDAAMRMDETPEIVDTFVIKLATLHRELLQSYPVQPATRERRATTRRRRHPTGPGRR